jgi:hypothetical protein
MNIESIQSKQKLTIADFIRNLSTSRSWIPDESVEFSFRLEIKIEKAW